MGYVDPITKAWVYEEGDNPTTDPEYGSFSGMLNRSSRQVPVMVHERVVQELSTDTTIREAAGEAMDEALEESPRIPTMGELEGVSAVVVDANGYHTFMAADDVDGSPTPHASRRIGSKLTLETLPHVPIEERVVPGISAAVMAGELQTFLTANDEDGGPTPHAARLIAAHVAPLLDIPTVPDHILHPPSYLAELTGGDVYVNDLATGQRRKVTDGVVLTDTPQIVGSSVVFSTAEGQRFVPVAGGQVGPIYPTSNVICRGDSHVNGAAGEGTNINTVLAADLGVAVTNDGHGGWGSSDVALNAGAISAALTIAGNTVPPSGPVTITAKTPTGGWRTFGGNTIITIPGILHTPSGDVPGVFTFTAATRLHEFTRTTPGDPIACPPGTPFTGGNGHQNETQVIWCGSNDVPYGADAEAAYTAFLANVAAMVNAQASLAKRTLVLSLPTGASDYAGSSNYVRRTTASQRLAAIYGDTYLDARRHLIDHGLEEAGIVPTADDLYSIERDTIPGSLMHNDRTHLLAPGLTMVANLIADRMRALGWY